VFFLKYVLNCEQNFSFFIFWFGLSVTGLARVYCDLVLQFVPNKSQRWKSGHGPRVRQRHWLLSTPTHCEVCLIKRYWSEQGLTSAIRTAHSFHLRSLYLGFVWLLIRALCTFHRAIYSLLSILSYVCGYCHYHKTRYCCHGHNILITALISLPPENFVRPQRCYCRVYEMSIVVCFQAKILIGKKFSQMTSFVLILLVDSWVVTHV
jgi:hypothetical protein